MTIKNWKLLPYDECDICGCGVEVFTDASGDGECYDGDAVRCPECGQRGVISVDEEWDEDEEEEVVGTEAWIDWDWEEPEVEQ